ncbi:MAG: hypothetical protein Kow0029_15310 [Candidatus Rifleibacteriota bacterium]
MSGDRRKSDTRRVSDRRGGDRRRNNDRRGNSSDRRGNSSRRTADVGAKSPNKSAKEEARKDSGNAAEFFRTFLTRLIRKFAIVFSIVLLIFTGLIVYFFSNIDYYMGRIAQNVNIELTRASVDPESLTDRTTRARLYFKIENRLPLSIVFQNLKMNVRLSDYIIAKGVQIMPREKIDAHSEKVVKVEFHVDSIMTRRGLQKTVEKNAGPILKSFLDRLGGKNSAITENLKGVMKIEGSTEFRLVLGGVEIPFARQLPFNATK